MNRASLRQRMAWLMGLVMLASVLLPGWTDPSSAGRQRSTDIPSFLMVLCSQGDVSAEHPTPGHSSATHHDGLHCALCGADAPVGLWPAMALRACLGTVLTEVLAPRLALQRLPERAAGHALARGPPLS